MAHAAVVTTIRMKSMAVLSKHDVELVGRMGHRTTTVNLW